MNENLVDDVMKVFPSLSIDKARFLLESFGEENTRRLILDMDKTRAMERALIDQLKRQVKALSKHSSHNSHE